MTTKGYRRNWFGIVLENVCIWTLCILIAPFVLARDFIRGRNDSHEDTRNRD